MMNPASSGGADHAPPDRSDQVVWHAPRVCDETDTVGVPQFILAEYECDGAKAHLRGGRFVAGPKERWFLVQWEPQQTDRRRKAEPAAITLEPASLVDSQPAYSQLLREFRSAVRGESVPEHLQKPQGQQYVKPQAATERQKKFFGGAKHLLHYAIDATETDDLAYEAARMRYLIFLCFFSGALWLRSCWFLR